MELQDGQYRIDGVSVTSLCEEFGTPLFAYETAKMQQQYDRMKQAFDVKHLKINYAMKALSNLSVLKFFKKLGSGLDTVSVQEVQLGLKAGFDTIQGPQNVPFPDALDPRTFVAHEGKGQYSQFLRASLQHEATSKSLLNGLFIKLASDYPGLVPMLGGSAPGTVYKALFADWVSQRDGPWAACVNLMDAHLPYTPKDRFNRWGDGRLLDIQESTPGKWELTCSDTGWWERKAIEQLYDGTILQVDSVVEEIIGTLERSGELDDTLVIVTSDHGEGFGELSQTPPGCTARGL
jgi:arylsulfatase